ncbi:MAG: hypothetical protein EOM76_07605 [Sphingobacteriia bacterium]|nr:hypothetical protein [Sphingobacteriia bacterium]
MKKLIFIFSLLIPLCAFAGEKVVDKSSRQPKWVNGLEKDFLIVAGTGSTLETAKETALLQIKKQVLSAVAERVETESSLNVREITIEGVPDIRTQFLSEIKTRGANMPFLQEVTLSKASDFYWEKIKKNKEYFYRYHVKYPFSTFDLSKLMDVFESREMSLNLQLQEFIDEDFEEITAVEDISDKIAEVKVFQKGLLDGDSRFNVCASIISRYNKIYDNIFLKLESVSREQLVYGIYLGNKRLVTTLKPQFKSNCLTQMAYDIDGSVMEVSYSYESCYEDESNYLEVIYKFGLKKVSNQFFVR